MSEQALNSIVAIVGTILGAFLGYLGSLSVAKRTMEASREKDSFEIARVSLETRIRSLSQLRRACDSYLRVGFLSDDPKVQSAVFRELVTGVCDVLAETPWAFSDKIRAVESHLKRDLCQVEATSNEAVRPLLGDDLETICANTVAAGRTLYQNVLALQSLAEDEMNGLIEERRALMDGRIPA